MQLQPKHRRVRLVDIDGVFFRQTTGDGKVSEPKLLPGSLERVNAWFEDGDIVIFWTARVSEYAEITRAQLDSVGAKYHGILFDKPLADEIHVYDDANMVIHQLPRDVGLEHQNKNIDVHL